MVPDDASPLEIYSTFGEEWTSQIGSRQRSRCQKRGRHSKDDGSASSSVVDPSQLQSSNNNPPRSTRGFSSFSKFFGRNREPGNNKSDKNYQNTRRDSRSSPFSADEQMNEASPDSSTGSAAGSLSMESTQSTESSLGTNMSVHNRRSNDFDAEIGKTEDQTSTALKTEIALPEPSNTVAQPDSPSSELPLAIRILGVPSHGAKTRVETQVKMTLQLVETDTGHLIPETGYLRTLPDGSSYKVAGWRHFKVPQYLAAKSTKRRAMAADEVQHHEALRLVVEVFCASPGTNNGPIQACDACVIRERKRFLRRKAARTRPLKDTAANSVPEPDDPVISKQEREKIVMFSSGEVLDIPNGECEIPVRFTCYCRHHQEKIGFQLKLNAVDWKGRVVATGKTPSIMITDDHKSSISRPPSVSEQIGGGAKRSNHLSRQNSIDGSKASDSDLSASSSRASSVRPQKRRGASTPKSLAMTPLIPSHFSLPSDSYRMPPDVETITSAPLRSSQTSTSAYPFTSFAPLSTMVSGIAGIPSSASNSTTNPAMTVEQQIWNDQNSDPSFPFDSDSLDSRAATDVGTSFFNHPLGPHDPSSFSTSSPPSTQLRRPASVPNVSALLDGYTEQHRSPQGDSSIATMNTLIPAEGPTSGGQPISIIGSGLTPNLTVMFGDVPAMTLTFVNSSSMVVWLPPSPTPGPVVVSFRESPMQLLEGNLQAVQIFTYQDHADRDLMQLALQVIGVSMTGQVQDAHSIAQRILAGGQNSKENSEHPTNGEDTTMSDANIVAQMFTGKTKNFEALVIQSLGLLDRSARQMTCISLRNSRGHTLLHLAAQLGFQRLCTTLIARRITLEIQDNNGFTALHLAAWAGKTEVIKILRDAGLADNLFTRQGHLAIDLARDQGHKDIWRLLRKAWEFHDDSSPVFSRYSLHRLSSAASSRQSIASWCGTPLDSESDEDSVWIGQEADESNPASDESDDGLGITEDERRWRRHRSPSSASLDREGIPVVYSRRPSVSLAGERLEDRPSGVHHANEITPDQQQDLAKASALWLQQTFMSLSGKREPRPRVRARTTSINALSTDSELEVISRPRIDESPPNPDSARARSCSSSEDLNMFSDHSSPDHLVSQKLRKDIGYLPPPLQQQQRLDQSQSKGSRTKKYVETIKGDRMLWLFHMPILLMAVWWIIYYYSHPTSLIQIATRAFSSVPHLDLGSRPFNGRAAAVGMH